ncbi:hypothetical protein [Pseudomonas sp. S2_H01]
MSATQQVITIDDISADNAPVIYVAGGLKQFFEHAKALATGEVPDLTTRKGRERVASLAAEVSRSKAAVEKPGREYLKKIKEIPKVVEAELREFVNSMDALRDATRQPLTDWEKAEDARVDAHNDAIQQMKDLAVFTETPTAAHVANVIADLEMVELGESWEEFLPEAAQVKDRSLATLRALLADRTKHEAQLAEIAQFNAEKALREQQERDAAIAREAAERARREADERAAAELAAAAKREQDLKDQAAAQQRAAEQAARDAEAAAAHQALQLKLAAEQAERIATQAEANRLAAIQQAEQDRIAAEKRQAEAVERARQEELDRQAAAVAFELQQAQAREADKAHKGAIYKSAKEAFMKNGMTEDCARLAVKLIASNLIPAISIQY